MGTLPQQDTIIQYVANGITANYVVPFFTPISTIDVGVPAINVYVTPNGSPPIPADDLVTWNVNYLYTPNADQTTGGTLNFQMGYIPPNGATVTIQRNVPAELSTNFADIQTFSGQNLDNALQELLLIIQQNQTYNFQRNLSYVVNANLPQADIVAQTQLPVLGANQQWVGTGSGVMAATIEENPDTSLLRSQLASQLPNADGALLVGFYNFLASQATTVDGMLNQLVGNGRLIGTDSGSVNALQLTLVGNTAVYTPGLEVWVYPANTGTGAATFQLNSQTATSIRRRDGAIAQPGDIQQDVLLKLVFDGSVWVMDNVSIDSGIMQDFGGGTVPAGYLLCNGTTVSRTVYSELFAAIGTTWGVGDGSTTFNIPGLARRNTVGSGGVATSPAFTGTTTGSLGGEEVHTQTASEVGVHDHPFTVPNAAAQTNVGGSPGIGTGSTGSNKTASIANNQSAATPFNVMQLGAVVTKMIKI